ncbi:MAG: 4Fe-4S binding protein [bacterium]|nr:4Fe-4S binding protein [bacterium]
MIFLCIWIGLELYFFAYTAMYRNGLPLPTRPAGVDGFLPITGLMGLYDWFQFGELNTVHPSATILLITFIIISFIFRKTFCSWLCPIGTLSEWLATLGRKILKKNFKLTKWMDYPLRSLKYLLFFFFLYSIFAMGKWGVHYFLHSPYNKVADVKMGLFFIQLGTIGAIVLIVLVIASILIYNFWCRYLCPYGALLGFFSFFSPLQVTRNADDCTDCGICNQVCSANLPIMSKNKIYSVECTGCFDCVASCPIPSALTTKMVHKKVKISFIGIGLVSIFIGIWLLAKVTDHWDNKISDQEYRKLIKNINEYSHPGRK